jgi:2-methylisocitrate lyase-like PEP mutase family enzyme
MRKEAQKGFLQWKETLMATQAEKIQTFRVLHETSEPFIIPNPWDAGSALLFEETGFKALATTSSGFAQSLGKSDGEVTLDEKLCHCRLLSSLTDVPINADFEHGFADAPEDVAKNVLKLAETGVAGASIEDYSRSAIYDFALSVDRVSAAVEALRVLPFALVLTARAEGLLRGTHTLEDVIKRLLAFEAAGADVLYAPGLKSLEDVKEVVAAVSKPVNVLAPFLPGVSLADYAEAGVSRVSVGGAFAGRIRAATLTAAKQMFDTGRFD